MNSKKPNDCSYAEKRKAAMQLKRRNTYSQVSAHKREALLLSRGLQTDFPTHNLLGSATADTPMQPTSSSYRANFPKKVALTIIEPPVLYQKAISQQVQPTQPQDNLDKWKQVCDPPTISQTTTGHEIHAAKVLDNLGKGKQICNPFTFSETGKSPLCLGF